MARCNKLIFMMIILGLYIRIQGQAAGLMNSPPTNHTRNSYHGTANLPVNVTDIVQSDEARLIQMLMRQYENTSPMARPVLNSSNPVKVDFRLSLQKIIDFDEKNQVLTTYLWKERWTDEILRWNPDDFGGLNKTRIPPSKIWIPDVILFNDLDHSPAQFDQDRSIRLILEHTGYITWIKPTVSKSSCTVDPTNFPFDLQTCELKYGSWTYDISSIYLDFLKDQAEFDTKRFVLNSEWEIVENKAIRHDKKYECCEETYSDLTYELVLRRRPAYFARFMLLPTILLSFMVLFIFWIPPQRPDRTGLGMSLFTSFMLLLLLVVDTTPPTDSSKLGAFCCYNIIGVSTATFLSIMVVNLALCKQPMPPKLKAISKGG